MLSVVIGTLCLLVGHGVGGMPPSDVNEPPEIPQELQVLPVDVDGDGKATLADKLTLVLWGEIGGNFGEAIAHGVYSHEGVLDISAFFAPENHPPPRQSIPKSIVSFCSTILSA